LRDRAHGFSLLELAVVLAVLSALLYFLLDRVLTMQEMAERTEVEETLRAIDYGLRLEAASRMARGAAAGRPALEEENPVKWVSPAPKNYLGEFREAPRNAQPGSWYFLTGERQLVYRPRRSEHLAAGEGQAKELRFAVRRRAGEPQPGIEVVSAHAWFGRRVEVRR
jgi:prepilin-type N-terminal cleavage/methylation domain-containing protein